MANYFLLKSSIFLGAINIIFVFYFNSVLSLKLCLCTGVLSSILNHGLTSNYLKFLDRFAMIYGILAEIILIYQINHYSILLNITLLISCSSSFLIAKKLELKNK